MRVYLRLKYMIPFERRQKKQLNICFRFTFFSHSIYRFIGCSFLNRTWKRLVFLYSVLIYIEFIKKKPEGDRKKKRIRIKFI